MEYLCNLIFLWVMVGNFAKSCELVNIEAQELLIKKTKLEMALI